MIVRCVAIRFHVDNQDDTLPDKPNGLCLAKPRFSYLYFWISTT